MVTAAEERWVVRAALEAGATEFITKPVDHIEFHHRISNLLQLRQAQNQLRRHTEALEHRVVRSVETIAEREIEIIVRLSRAAERRDNETGQHVIRMAALSRLVAEGLGLNSEACKTLYVAAPLHDVGKIGLPDSILLKPGRLTVEERREMERHAVVGHEILAGSSSELIQRAAEIALHHHERWDGTGYPHRLVERAIPLWARIASVADVFDALASERPYKNAWPLAEVRRYFVENAGIQFDPTCVEALLKRWPEIALLYQSPAELPKVA
jgi:putative two-component system response regulator